MAQLVRSSWALAAIVALLAFGGCKPEPSSPAPTGTIAEHLSAGRTSLEAALVSKSTDEFLDAIQHYLSAAALIGVDGTATQSDVDSARFFGGLAHVAILARPYSDLDPTDGLNDLGDLLDGFGLGGTALERSNLDTMSFTTCVQQSYCDAYGCWSTQNCELKPFPADSPTGQELQTFLTESVEPGLRLAADLLGGVSTSFSAQIHDGGRAIDMDQADALFLRSFAFAEIASIEIQQAYDLNVDVDDLRSKVEAQGTPPYVPEGLLSDYPLLLKLRSATTLPSARADAIAGAQAFRLALAALRAETDDQSDDLIAIADQQCFWTGYTMQCVTTYNPAQQLDDMDRVAGQIEALLSASGTYTFDGGNLDPSDDVTVDPSRFFAGMDIRSLLPANFTSGKFGDAPGMLPDPTFGGILVASPMDLSSDLDADASPDFLNGYSYFFDGYLAGHTLRGAYQRCYYDPQWYWICTWVDGTFAFGVGNAFTYSAPAYSATTYAGTYAYSADILTLTFDPVAGGPTVASVHAPDYLKDDGFRADGSFTDATGTWSFWGWWTRQ